MDQLNISHNSKMRRVLIFDSRWEGSSLCEQVKERYGIDSQVAVFPVCSYEYADSLRGSVGPHDSLYVIGGGSVVDLVKLVHIGNHHPLRPYLCSGRAGLVFIPSKPLSSINILITTVGTGSEINRKALVEVTPKRRRLVVSPAIRTHPLVDDFGFYRHLPKELFVKGVLEIFMRAFGALTAIRSKETRTHVMGILHDIAGVYHEALFVSAPQSSPQRIKTCCDLSRTLQQITEVQSTALWAWPLWYLANELSSVVGVSKMEATIHLFPIMLEHIGRFGVGNRADVDLLSRSIGSTAKDFADSLSVLLEYPKLPVPVFDQDEDLIERLTKQSLSQWGGWGLPLEGATHTMLYRLFSSLWRKGV